MYKNILSFFIEFAQSLVQILFAFTHILKIFFVKNSDTTVVKSIFWDTIEKKYLNKLDIKKINSNVQWKYNVSSKKYELKLKGSFTHQYLVKKFLERHNQKLSKITSYESNLFKNNTGMLLNLKDLLEFQNFFLVDHDVRYYDFFGEINRLHYKTSQIVNEIKFILFKNNFFIKTWIFKKTKAKWHVDADRKHRLFYRQKFNSIFVKPNHKNVKSSLIFSFLGLKSLWSAVRHWTISCVFFFLSLYTLSILKLLPASVTLFQWFALGMFLYWLISGFVFFIKKYRFTRFTSSIQRFWRRSYILFWLIESNLLLVFLYLTVNSTQEAMYMYDQVSFFKSHLFSWKIFIPKLFLVTLLVSWGYLVLLNLKWNIFNKNLMAIVVITIILTYLVWLEFYQIYHISNFYSNFYWNYDLDEKLWSLETDARRTRIVNHYTMILFFLKFWHIVFIYGFWIFFILRSLELTRIRFPIYSSNYQNFVILYVMTWLFMYPWAKFLLNRYIEIPYFWFYVNNREIFSRVFVNDIKLICISLAENLFKKNLRYFYVTDYMYFTSYFSNDYATSLRKTWIRNNIINTINNNF